MEELIMLSQLVDKNAEKRIDIVGNPASYMSKMNKLYEGILSGNLKNDREALENLYGEEINQKVNYNKLKRRLYQRLLNTLLFIDANKLNFNESQIAYYYSYKEYASLKIVIGRGGRQIAIKLAEKILNKALEFEITDLAVNVSKELRSLYANFEGDQKKFNSLNLILKRQMEILNIELLAEEFYLSLSMHYVKSIASKLEFVEIAAKYSNELLPHFNIVSTQRFIFFAYTVLAMRYQIDNNYSKTLEVSLEAIEALKNKGKLAQKNFILGFLIKAISCQIQLKQYQEANKTIEECLQLAEYGSYNWYLVKDYQILLHYHSTQYEHAIEIFLEARSLPDFNRLPSHYKEQWVIHEAYFHYLIAIKKISPSLKILDDMGKFRLTKFLNDVPEYSKDKRGSNISLLVIQLMFLIQQKKYEDFSDRLAALEMYSHRYLRKDETFRSNCFIHMMMQIPKGYFNKKNVARKAEKYVEKLKEMPLEVANQSGELEFIPYETLWAFVISTLKG